MLSSFFNYLFCSWEIVYIDQTIIRVNLISEHQLDSIQVIKHSHLQPDHKVNMELKFTDGKFSKYGMAAGVCALHMR